MAERKNTQAVEPLDRNKKIYVAGHRRPGRAAVWFAAWKRLDLKIL